MKAVWFLAFLVIAIEGKGIFVNVCEDQIPIILQASAECVSKYGVEQDTIKKVVNWTVQDTEPIRKFLFCFSTSAGYANDEGRIVIDNMLKLVDNQKKKAEYIDVMNECNKINGSDLYDTHFKIAACFMGRSPLLFKL